MKVLLYSSLVSSSGDVQLNERFVAYFQELNVNHTNDLSAKFAGRALPTSLMMDWFGIASEVPIEVLNAKS